MALKINCSTPQGFDVVGAYCRIEDMRVTKNSMSFALRRYKDSASQQSFLDVLYTAPYALTGVNPLQQGYFYLKALPAFQGSVDIFEAGQPQG